MSVLSYDSELTSSIPPAKLFKAFVLDIDNLVPKVLPQAVKSVHTIQGDGGVGTVKLITFGEEGQFKSSKDRVDGIDTEKLTYSHSIIEGDILMGVIEKISYDIKVEASPNGGCVCKITSKYHPKKGAQIIEEQIKDGIERVYGMFKAIEAYLLANPAYN